MTPHGSQAPRGYLQGGRVASKALNREGVSV